MNEFVPFVFTVLAFGAICFLLGRDGPLSKLDAARLRLRQALDRVYGLELENHKLRVENHKLRGLAAEQERGAA